MSGRLYTGTGDRGETSLCDGRRVPKDDPRVEAYGTLDEATAVIGLARVAVADAMLTGALDFLQHRLYACAAQVAGARPETLRPLSAGDVSFLERAIDEVSKRTPEPRGFVLAGGNEPSARLDLARCVVRRAERRCTALPDLDGSVAIFLNRASDLLFAASRLARLLGDIPEEPWDAFVEPPVG